MFFRTAQFAFASTVFLLAALPGGARGDEAEDQYKVAAAHYARGQWGLAVEEFDTLLRRFPSHPKAEASCFFMAEALLQEQRRAQAAERFAEYLRRAPAGPYASTARFRLAEADYLAGRFAEARERLEAFWTSRPDDPLGEYVLPYLGEIALAQGRPEAAADHFREAIKRFPDSGMKHDYRLGLARSLAQSGKPDEAAAIYRAIAAEPLGSLSVEARFRLGAAQYTQGRHDEAIATLRALEEDAAAMPWRARGRLIRSLSLRKLGRLDEAAKLLTEVSSDPAIGVEAQYWLAAVRKDQRQWDAAAKTLLAAAEKHPDHPWIAAIRYHAGEALALAGRPDEADRQFDLVLNTMPEGNAWLDDAAMGKIRSAVARKDHRAVDRQSQQFLQRFPNSPMADRAARARADALKQLGQHEAAVAAYKTVLDKLPASEGAQRSKIELSVARLHNRLGQHDEAVAIYERLAKQQPAGAAQDVILYEWSWTLSDMNRPDEAAAVLARLQKEFPRSRYGADAAYRLAQRAAAAGDRATAQRLVGEALAGDAPAEIEQHALALACRLDAAEERWDDVARSAQRLLDKHPGGLLQTVAEFWLAESLYRRADYAAAAEQLDQLMREIPQQPETWLAMVPLRRAQILAIDRNWTDAYELASTIERDYPGFDRQYEADYLLGRCLAARAEFEAARAAYRRAIDSPQGAKTETAAMAQWMIGETFFHQKNYAAAVREYLRVEILYDYPRWQAAALVQAGKCYEQLGQPGEARKLYQRVAQDYPVRPFVEEAKGRLTTAARSGNSGEVSRRPAAPRQK